MGRLMRWAFGELDFDFVLDGKEQVVFFGIVRAEVRELHVGGVELFGCGGPQSAVEDESGGNDVVEGGHGRIG